MLKERIAAYMIEVRAIDGVEGCALVTKDGIMIGRSFPREIQERWFAAMTASVLASAESAAGIVGLPPPVTVQISSDPGRCVLLHDAGEKVLIASVLAEGADPSAIDPQVGEIARRIGEAL